MAVNLTYNFDNVPADLNLTSTNASDPEAALTRCPPKRQKSLVLATVDTTALLAPIYVLAKLQSPYHYQIEC